MPASTRAEAKSKSQQQEGGKGDDMGERSTSLTTVAWFGQIERQHKPLADVAEKTVKQYGTKCGLIPPSLLRQRGVADADGEARADGRGEGCLAHRDPPSNRNTYMVVYCSCPGVFPTRDAAPTPAPNTGIVAAAPTPSWCARPSWRLASFVAGKCVLPLLPPLSHRPPTSIACVFHGGGSCASSSRTARCEFPLAAGATVQGERQETFRVFTCVSRVPCLVHAYAPLATPTASFERLNLGSFAMSNITTTASDVSAPCLVCPYSSQLLFKRSRDPIFLQFMKM